MSRGAARLEPFGTTIFAEMTALAVEHDAINLGQGFPDFEGPPDMIEQAIHGLRSGQNQYTRSMGRPELVTAIAARLRDDFGIDIDPLTQITVTCGATEGIVAAMLGLVEPGDEVLLFEPFYDSYPAAVAMAGAQARYLTLRFPDFQLDEEALDAAIGPRTKLLVLNDPHNPTGKVFNPEELRAIGRRCVEHDVIVLADAVYEQLWFDDTVPYTPIATLPGMADRTLTLSSAGKTYSYTGWKVGWAFGPQDLVAATQRAHQFLTFCTPAPLQLAVAHALMEHAAPYCTQLRNDYRERRDFLADALSEVGFKVAVPAGTYFLLADFTPLFSGDDRAFARHLCEQHGVACIPPSAFYQDAPDEGQRLARFAFCKRMATLETAAERMRGLRPR